MWTKSFESTLGDQNPTCKPGWADTARGLLEPAGAYEGQEEQGAKDPPPNPALVGSPPPRNRAWLKVPVFYRWGN